MRARHQTVLSLTILALTFTSCGPSSDDLTKLERPEAVYTTFWPLQWMTEQLCGDVIPVVCPLPPGADPHVWRPARETIVDYQNATLIVTNGATLEKWTKIASLPQSRVVDTTRGLDAQFITFETTTHSHGGGESHTHEGVDPHLWMDPILLKSQLKAVHRALVSRMKEHEDTFDQGFDAVAKKLDAVDAAWRTAAAKLQTAQVFSNHQAFAYPARRYAFDVTDLDLDPAGDLSDGDLAKLKAQAAPGDKQRILLWEAQPNEALAKRLEAEFQMKSVVIPTSEGPPEDIDADYATIATTALKALSGV